MKEAASILLQTIPDTIDIHGFKKQILQKFPEIESIHDLHIWQLTQQKFVSTAHIIFLDPPVYEKIISDILGFFHEQGINIVTIQPEFKNYAENEVVNQETRSLADGALKDLCLVACRKTTCEEKLCCKIKTPCGSTESVNLKSVQLEQVISVRNVSAEELSSISNYTSAKSLNASEDSLNMKQSSTSLPATMHYRKKLQKAISANNAEHQQIPAASTSEGRAITTKCLSESVIKADDHDLGREDSDILVENRMLKQLDTTDNNEEEDLYMKCDREV